MIQKVPCTTPLGSASRFALSIRISSSIAFIETPDLQERGRETVVVNVPISASSPLYDFCSFLRSRHLLFGRNPIQSLLR